MSMIRIEASHVIDARPEDVYAIMADYRVSHPAILPKPYFTNLIVEKGGQGAGTVTRVFMKVWGTEFKYHQIVSEPQLGRVLVETDIDTGQYTEFIFEPLNGGTQTRMTIAGYFPASPGLRGVIERLTQPSVTRRIFLAELYNVNAYAQKHPSPASIG